MLVSVSHPGADRGSQSTSDAPVRRRRLIGPHPARKPERRRDQPQGGDRQILRGLELNAETDRRTDGQTDRAVI